MMRKSDMIQEKEKILGILKRGKELLKERSELWAMEPEKVLDELDDTEEMLRDRWGVVAYLYTEKIKNCSKEELLKQLKQIQSGVLIYEYVGFILQQEQQVNLVELMIDGHRSGCQDEILPFVYENLANELTIDTALVSDFIEACNACKDQRKREMAVRNYAKKIVELEKVGDVIDDFLSTSREENQFLIIEICREMYAVDWKKANEILEYFWEKGTRLYVQTAIIVLQYGIRYSTVILENHLDDMERVVENGSVLWTDEIPIYTWYIQFGKGIKNQKIVLERLERIVHGDIEEKAIFLEQVNFFENRDKGLDCICTAILSESFDKNKRILQAVDDMFYLQVKRGETKTVLRQLLNIFVLNLYGSEELDDFFSEFGATFSIWPEEKMLLIDYMIDKILHGTTGEFLFGIGLWRTQISPNAVLVWMKSNTLQDKEILILQKSVLYYEYDENMICEYMFLFAQMLWDEKEYFKFCILEIYKNYPNTAYKFAKKHEDSDIPQMQRLAVQILRLENERRTNAEKTWKIPDLYCSLEREKEYRRAELEFKKNMQKENTNKSVFLSLFPSRTMKYGKRHAYIQRGRKGEFSYQVNEYQHISIKKELPNEYMKNMNLLNNKRRALEGERREYNATHN